MRIAEKHAAWVRILHWLNVPVLALMAWSGLLIYWANNAYPPFFPEPFYAFFGIDHRLAEGLAIHFLLAWPFALGGALFLLFTLSTCHWRELISTPASLRRIPSVILAEFGLVRAPATQEKFNPAQRLAYTGAILIGTLQALSGFALYKPVQLRWLTAALGGYESARFLHFAGMMLLFVFVLVHVLQVARAGWNNLRAMVAGFEIREEEAGDE